jgi:hypothetical protein
LHTALTSWQLREAQPAVYQGEEVMSHHILLEIEVPEDLKKLRLPVGVERRLHELLDRQDRGDELTQAERQEAEGLVDLAELLSLLRLRAQNISDQGSEA